MHAAKLVLTFPIHDERTGLHAPILGMERMMWHPAPETQTPLMMKYNAIYTAIALLLTAGLVACGNDGAETVDNDTTIGERAEEVFDDDDLNDDWDNDRFSNTFAENDRYNDWDADDDDLLDRDEYSQGMYDTWDRNNDDRLDQDEWNTATNDFGLENENWDDWDANDDDFLDSDEWNEGFNDNDWFGSWDLDRDDRVNEDEFGDGLFGFWDRNDNDRLEANERGTYDTYYGENR